MSVIAFCSSVLSRGLSATAIRFGTPGRVTNRGGNAGYLRPDAGPAVRRREGRLVAGGVARREAARRAIVLAPPRSGARAAVLGREAVAAAGVEAQASDHHVGVAGVGVHGDPAALARTAPAHEAAGVQRTAQEPAAVQGEADRARAVIPAIERRGHRVAPAVGLVATAVEVGLAHDPVGGLDGALHAGRCAGGRDRQAVHDLRALGAVSYTHLRAHETD